MSQLFVAVHILISFVCVCVRIGNWSEKLDFPHFKQLKLLNAAGLWILKDPGKIVCNSPKNVTLCIILRISVTLHSANREQQ